MSNKDVGLSQDDINHLLEAIGSADATVESKGKSTKQVLFDLNIGLNDIARLVIDFNVCEITTGNIVRHILDMRKHVKYLEELEKFRRDKEVQDWKEKEEIFNDIRKLSAFAGWSASLSKRYASTLLPEFKEQADLNQLDELENFCVEIQNKYGEK